MDVLQGSSGATLVQDGPTFLSQLLFYSASISASKLVPSTGYRYALRVNPSSGNLHPTEFHFFTRALKDWPNGLYHYRPSSHMAEQRALGDIEMNLARPSCPITFVLTTIAWREAWKYRDRAYRYCLHDIGHAWQALALAARAIGCHTFALGQFPDDEVAQLCRLQEDEWPMLIVGLRGGSIPVHKPDHREVVWFGGDPNQLSKEKTTYSQIEEIHEVTKFRRDSLARHNPASDSPVSEPAPIGTGDGAGGTMLPSPASSTRPFGEVVRMRRSALDFVGGTKSMSLTQFWTLVAATNQPLNADFATPRFIQLYLYVHRVSGLEPGVYRLSLKGAGLERLKSGDQRVVAAGLSLGQDLAGNACVAFSMIGDFERATRAHGDRGYRYVHFEAGAIGHRLYLAAEALGLGATGIGAFYDEEVHRYLNLTPDQGRVVYHFAVGYPVPDYRVNA